MLVEPVLAHEIEALSNQTLESDRIDPRLRNQISLNERDLCRCIQLGVAHSFSLRLLGSMHPYRREVDLSSGACLAVRWQEQCHEPKLMTGNR
jgi:hypothetical protein